MAVTREQVMEALKSVNDPELHRSIVELDMVKDIQIDGGHVAVTINLTVMGCPLKSRFEQDVEANLKQISGVEKVTTRFGAMTEAEKAAVAAKVRGGNAQAHAQAAQSTMQMATRTTILGIASGKGGVGKSTTTVNLAVALKKLGYEVGIIDADIYGFSIPRMMGNMSRPESLDENMLLPVWAHGIRFISAGSLVNEDQAIIWRGPMLGKMIEQFLTNVQWGKLDYLLIDLPPGTGDVALSIAQMLPNTDLVLVTTPQAAAAQVASRVASMAEKTNQRIVGVVENMAYFICDNCDKKHEIFGKGGAQALAANLGCDVIARIPLVGDVRLGSDVGDPIVSDKEEHPAAQAYLEAARQIAKLSPPKVWDDELRIL
ncbi:MAG TPA: Mrp/NBP35 family ATP-binding protein [Symbiobacteriaceae bacterium]|jgi:ATP-binding protein involved in chromosome partitioning|nr:Mrp/NBP35 family ATP-binding protein [Symbiobacteriaceae bacterium]